MKLSDSIQKASHIAKSLWHPTVIPLTRIVDPASYPPNNKNFAYEVAGLLVGQQVSTDAGFIQNGDIVIFNSLGNITGVVNNGTTTDEKWILVQGPDVYTASPGDALLADTQTFGGFIIALPAAPVYGDLVSIAPVYPSYLVDNLIITAGAVRIAGILGEDLVLNENNISIELFYVDTDIGWAVINRGDTSIISNTDYRKWKVVDDINYQTFNKECLLLDTQTNAIDNPLGINVILPASPAMGDVVSLAPLYPTMHAYPVTIECNGSPIAGVVQDLLIDENNVTFDLYYVDDLIGWAVIRLGSSSVINTVISKQWKEISGPTAYDAHVGDALLLNSTTGDFDVNLPPAPVLGDMVSFAPAYPTFVDNEVRINSLLPIAGGASPWVINQNGVSIEMVYVNAITGWAVINKGDTTLISVITGGVQEIDYDSTTTVTINQPFVTYIGSEDWYTAFTPVGTDSEYLGPFLQTPSLDSIPTTAPAYNSWVSNGTITIPESQGEFSAVYPLQQTTGNRYLSVDISSITAMPIGQAIIFNNSIMSLDAWTGVAPLTESGDGMFAVTPYFVYGRSSGNFGGNNVIIPFPTITNALPTDSFPEFYNTVTFGVTYNSDPEATITVPAASYTWASLISLINTQLPTGITAYFKVDSGNNNHAEIAFHVLAADSVHITDTGNVSAEWLDIDFLEEPDPEYSDYVLPYGSYYYAIYVYIYNAITDTESIAAVSAQDPSISGTHYHNIVPDINSFPSKITYLISENIANNRTEYRVLVDGAAAVIYDANLAIVPYRESALYTDQPYMSQFQVSTEIPTSTSLVLDTYTNDPAADTLGYTQMYTPTTNDPTNLAATATVTTLATIPVTALSEGTVNHIVQDVIIGDTTYTADTFLHRHGNAVMKLGGGELPADAAGILTNDGDGNLSWSTPPTELPADAAGILTNDGDGNLSWSTPPTELPADAAGILTNDGDGNLSWGVDNSFDPSVGQTITAPWEFSSTLTSQTPTQPGHAATKQYVDDNALLSTHFLSDTVTGNVTVSNKGKTAEIISVGSSIRTGIVLRSGLTYAVYFKLETPFNTGGQIGFYSAYGEFIGLSSIAGNSTTTIRFHRGEFETQEYTITDFVMTPTDEICLQITYNDDSYPYSASLAGFKNGSPYFYETHEFAISPAHVESFGIFSSTIGGKVTIIPNPTTEVGGLPVSTEYFLSLPPNSYGMLTNDGYGNIVWGTDYLTETLADQLYATKRMVYSTLSSSGGEVTIDLTQQAEIFNLTLSEEVTSWNINWWTIPSGCARDITVNITQGNPSVWLCKDPASLGKTAGGSWVADVNPGSVESLSLRIYDNGNIETYPSGVFG